MANEGIYVLRSESVVSAYVRSYITYSLCSLEDSLEYLSLIDVITFSGLTIFTGIASAMYDRASAMYDRQYHHSRIMSGPVSVLSDLGPAGIMMSIVEG